MRSSQERVGAEGRSWWRRLLGRAGRGGEGDAEVVFPSGFLESLERLRLVALRASGGGLKEGHRLGAYRGGQLEFHDHRAYSPGDDPRYLDWNLYARLGRPFIKEFAREEAGCAYLLLDGTASMGLGRPPKWTFARRLAALFAHIAWSSRDQMTTLAFAGPGRPLQVYPQRGQRPGIGLYLEWLRRLVLEEGQVQAAPGPAPGSEPEGGPGGSLSLAVRAFLRNGWPRGRVYLLSDFWMEEAEFGEALQRLTGARFEVAAVHILAPEETRLLERGPLRVLSVEEAGEVELTATLEAATLYERELERHREGLRRALRRRGGQYLFASSDLRLESVLLQSLRQRHWLT